MNKFGFKNFRLNYNNNKILIKLILVFLFLFSFLIISYNALPINGDNKNDSTKNTIFDDQTFEIRTNPNFRLGGTQTLEAENGSVILLQDANPWSSTAIPTILDSHGISYNITPSSQFGLVDLTNYQKVIIASDQPNSFYQAINSHLSWFETYVASGGILEIHGASDGWNTGTWVNPLPGGLFYNKSSTNSIDIVDSQHPVLNTPYNITDAELDGWGSSAHGFLSNISSAKTILADGINPILIELEYGYGTMIVSTQTLEYGYDRSESNLLENLLLFWPINDLESPNITNSGDISFLYGEKGHNVTWNITDQTPGTYYLYINNELKTDDPWKPNDLITVKLDSFSPGIYNFTISVFDNFGNNATNSVIVTITSNITPVTTSTSSEISSETSSIDTSSSSSIISNTSSSNTQNSGIDPIIGVGALFLIGGPITVATTLIVRRYRKNN
ncbi:MAG: hypothetical protein ACW981_04085 [Candidatus Hodarchaeales archaeon]|jgi:hypothetical protein